jgi:hypothetical protein
MAHASHPPFPSRHTRSHPSLSLVQSNRPRNDDLSAGVSSGSLWDSTKTGGPTGRLQREGRQQTRAEGVICTPTHLPLVWCSGMHALVTPRASSVLPLACPPVRWAGKDVALYCNGARTGSIPAHGATLEEAQDTPPRTLRSMIVRHLRPFHTNTSMQLHTNMVASKGEISRSLNNYHTSNTNNQTTTMVSFKRYYTYDSSNVYVGYIPICVSIQSDFHKTDRISGCWDLAPKGTIQRGQVNRRNAEYPTRVNVCA